jgi:apolipoprotein N-acyltransferase
LLVAGGVHAVKATARPAVTATTGGFGNWLVSLSEDVVAFVTTVMAILVPVLLVLLMVLFFLLLAWWWSKRRTRHAE